MRALTIYLSRAPVAIWAQECSSPQFFSLPPSLEDWCSLQMPAQYGGLWLEQVKVTQHD